MMESVSQGGASTQADVPEWIDSAVRTAWQNRQAVVS